MARKRDEQEPEPADVGETVDEAAASTEGEASGLPNPWEVMAKIAAAMDTIAKAVQQSGPNEGLMRMQEKLTTALERLADANVRGSQIIADETRRAHRPSNEVITGISVFNRRGLQLPADAEGPRKGPLVCQMLIPYLAEWESLTREEVDLLNLIALAGPNEYELKRIDNSRVRVTVQVKYKVDGKTPHVMLLNHESAFNNDNFKLIPPLAEWARFILKQTPYKEQAAAVMTDEEEEALIEAGVLSTAA